MHLHADSTGATEVARRQGLQRRLHQLDVCFLWVWAETVAERVRICEVHGPEDVADSDAKLADRRSNSVACV